MRNFVLLAVSILTTGGSRAVGKARPTRRASAVPLDMGSIAQNRYRRPSALICGSRLGASREPFPAGHGVDRSISKRFHHDRSKGAKGGPHGSSSSCPLWL